MMLINRWPKASYNVLSIVVGAIPKSRSAYSINHQIYGKSSQLLIGGDVFRELRQLLQLDDKTVRPIIQLRSHRGPRACG